MPIDELFKILRCQNSAHAAWIEILELGQSKRPSGFWSELPNIKLNRDIAEVKAWLDTSLSTNSAPTRVYFGLDTLNMGADDAFNIEIGWCNADTNRSDVEWIYEELTYGQRHLIKGLSELHAVYSNEQWSTDFQFADYFLFLAYSGLLVREAFKRAQPTTSFLVAWGFHDGDVFLLCRAQGRDLELLA